MITLEFLILLLFIGLIIFIMGLILTLIASSAEDRESKVEGGGAIIIGPIPIVWGTSQRITLVLLILAIILTIVTTATYLLLRENIP